MIQEKKRSPSDLRRMGIIAKLEYYTLAYFKEKTGKEPVLNDIHFINPLYIVAFSSDYQKLLQKERFYRLLPGQVFHLQVYRTITVHPLYS